MKKTILLSFLLAMVNFGFAQFGVTTGYRWHDAPDFKYVSNDGKETDILANTSSIGIDYQFRFKNSRIEILPEISATFKQKITASYGRFPDGAAFESKFYNLSVNTLLNKFPNILYLSKKLERWENSM